MAAVSHFVGTQPQAMRRIKTPEQLGELVRRKLDPAETTCSEHTRS